MALAEIDDNTQLLAPMRAARTIAACLFLLLGTWVAVTGLGVGG